MIYLFHTLKWNGGVVFDGGKSPAKRYEDERREGDMHNHPTYIALAAKICEDLFIPYVVATEEADSQAVKYIPNIGKPTLIVTGDSDLLACGAAKVVVVRCWHDESYRFYDLSRLTEREGEGQETNSLIRLYTICGSLAFQYWAAC